MVSSFRLTKALAHGPFAGHPGMSAQGTLWCQLISLAISATDVT
jgi:hypothetical protein